MPALDVPGTKATRSNRQKKHNQKRKHTRYRSK
jgi:hypothetical protein